MPNNPNRRPGVDANIVEANTVRGHDTRNTGNVPGDLLISTGRNDGDDVVGIVTVWNRTDDRDEQVVDLRAGLDVGTATRIQVFVGDFDPTGIVTATQGSLFVNNNPAELWQNTDGAMAWIRISDDLGGESLEETLVIGNSTGPNAIVVSDDPLALIQGEDSADSTGGGTVRIRGGNESGAVGNGGGLTLGTGTTVGGNSGGILALTANVTTGAGFSGDAEFGTGTALVKAGSTTIRAGTGDTGGAVFVLAGEGIDNDANGAAGGGLVSIQGGNGVGSNGGGGDVFIGGGDVDPSLPSFNIKILGQGGRVFIDGGLSAGAVTGGGITLRAGQGGPSGGVGGQITLSPGSGGGAADDGQVVATGVFRSDNLQRGNGDPNVGAVPGNEGDLYQRIDGGQGEVWVNTNGSSAGWARLAISGSLVAALTRVQGGSFEPAGSDRGGSPEDRYSATGLLKGLNVYEAGTATVDHGQATAGGGPMISFEGSGGVGLNVAGIDQTLNTSSDILALEHDFIAAFKFRNTGTGVAHIMFMGYSTNDINAQLSADAPALGEYVGFVKSGSSGNWFFVNRGPTNFNLVDSGVNSLATLGGTPGRPHYYVIDASDTTNVVVRHLLLNSDFEVLAQFLAVGPGGAVPSNGTRLQLCMGVRNQGALGVADLQIFKAGVVTQADKVEELGGGGGGLAIPTLEQVLIAGNETGVNSIALSSGGFIGGVLDGAAPNGAPVIIIGGFTTGVGDNGGDVQISGGISTALGATGTTGGLLFVSGTIADATASADTGGATFGSGSTAGTGDTGDVVIASGAALGGGTNGDILMAPGTFAATGSIPGLFDMRGGSTTLAGVDGGNVEITGGESTNIASSSTGQVRIETPDAVGTGAGGTVVVTLGDGGPTAGLGGNMVVTGGTSFTADDAGSFLVLAGVATGTGNGGDFLAAAGPSLGGDGGVVTIAAGQALGGVGFGGDIDLVPGTGPSGDGVVRITGKLTVTGLIDPTGLVLESQAVNPYVPGAPGEGTLWIDVATDELKYTTSAGTVNLSTGGAGGTLSSVLGAGDTSGGNNIVMTAGGVVTSDGTTTVSGDITSGATRPGRIDLAPDVGDNGGGGTLFGGEGDNLGTGGAVSVQGGTGGPGGGDGGAARLRGGDGGGGGDGGSVSVISGDGAAPGDVVLRGSPTAPIPIAIAAGNIQAVAADVAEANGGNLTLTPGAATVGGKANLHGGNAVLGLGADGGAAVVGGGLADSGGLGGNVNVYPGGVDPLLGGGDAGVLYLGTSGGVTGIAGEDGTGVVVGGEGSAVGVYLGDGGANLTGNAGDAGVFQVVGGNGGAATDGVSPTNAGDGSTMVVFTGLGGVATSAAAIANGGDGGDVAFLTGPGGPSTGDTGALSGSGGGWTATLGPGATATTTTSGPATGGSGGNWAVFIGGAGDGTGVDGGIGGNNGDFSWIGGSGGDGTATTTGSGYAGDGSRWTVVLGPGGAATGISGGVGGDGGSHQMVLGDGGTATTTTGVSTGGEGGSVEVAAGPGGDADGGNAPGVAGDGGHFQFNGGNGGDSTSADNEGGAGGAFAVVAGDGGTGTGTELGGAGGDISLIAGNAGPGPVPGQDGQPGNVFISAGSNLPGGISLPGQITFGSVGNGDQLNLNSPAIKVGQHDFAADPPGPHAGLFIPWGAFTQGVGGPPLSAFPAPPRSVQITFMGAIGNVVNLVPPTAVGITAAGITINTSAATAAGDELHVVAYK